MIFVDFDKDITFWMPAVDAGIIFWRQEIWKGIIEKHENPADEDMDVSSDEDVDEEIEDPERTKPASHALQAAKSYGSLVSLITRNFVSQL